MSLNSAGVTFYYLSFLNVYFLSFLYSFCFSVLRPHRGSQINCLVSQFRCKMIAVVCSRSVVPRFYLQKQIAGQFGLEVIVCQHLNQLINPLKCFILINPKNVWHSASILVDTLFIITKLVIAANICQTSTSFQAPYFTQICLRASPGPADDCCSCVRYQIPYASLGHLYFSETFQGLTLPCFSFVPLPSYLIVFPMVSPFLKGDNQGPFIPGDSAFRQL